MKARFVAALRAGTEREEAAAAEGFCLRAFYCARKRDPLFRSAWIWGMELRAVEEREARIAGEMAAAAEDFEIEPNNQRLLQRRRGRGNRFTDRRKQMFLDHFAGTADLAASARAAGVCISTVYKHRRADPVFAAGWDEALRTAYALLEAEAVRQRLEAQQRAAFAPIPSAEAALEFERVVKLLARLDRQGVRGVREVGRGGEKRASFEDAIRSLDRKLRALGGAARNERGADGGAASCRRGRRRMGFTLRREDAKGLRFTVIARREAPRQSSSTDLDCFAALAMRTRCAR